MPDESLRVPVFCPICGHLMKGQKATYTFYSYGCCMDCYIYWMDERPAAIKRWKDGWRPNPEELEKMKEFMKD